MHGLTVFQHDVVGDVHDVIDGTHAVGAQAAAQPLGGGGDLYVGNHPGGVAVAQLRCGDVHVQMVVNIPGVRAVNHRLVVTHGLAEGGGSFPGKADDAVAVGAVVGDLKIHNGVVVADDEVDVLANRAVLVIEDPDAVGEHAGQVVLGQTQLGEGAEHTVGRFAPELALGDVNAAGEPGVMQRRGYQIALMDILGAGDDLHGGIASHVHLANPHMIGVGVAHHGQNLAHDHVFDLRVQPLPGFHLLTEDGQGLHEFLIGDVRQVYEFLVQPFSVEFHCFSLLRTGSGTGCRCRKSVSGR